MLCVFDSVCMVICLNMSVCDAFNMLIVWFRVLIHFNFI